MFTALKKTNCIMMLKLKVYIFWEGHKNFAKSSPNFWLQYIRSKVRGRFRKILWPSQNIWTVVVVGVVSLLFRLPIAILCKVKYLSKSLLTSKNGQEIYKMPHGVLYFILATPDHGMWLKGSMTLHISLWAGFQNIFQILSIEFYQLSTGPF